MSAVIYKIKNNVTGDFYIGQSIDIKKRINSHFWHLERNKHHNLYLQRAYNKYGRENFSVEILVICEIIELTRYEQAMVDKLDPKYNVNKLCVNTALGVRRTEEQRENMSRAGKGRHPMSEEHKEKIRKKALGRITSEETRQKQSKAAKGRKLSEDQKRKLSICRRGIPVSQETRRKISTTLTGKPGHPVSEQSRRKISETLMGHLVSDETRAKLIGRKHSMETLERMSELRKGKCIGETNRNHKLSWSQVAEIREKYKNGISSRALGRIYNVHQSNILYIVKNKTWKKTI